MAEKSQDVHLEIDITLISFAFARNFKIFLKIKQW